MSEMTTAEIITLLVNMFAREQHRADVAEAAVETLSTLEGHVEGLAARLAEANAFGDDRNEYARTMEAKLTEANSKVDSLRRDLGISQAHADQWRLMAETGNITESITRFEVIDYRGDEVGGQAFVADDILVGWSILDDGHTFKVFVKERTPTLPITEASPEGGPWKQYQAPFPGGGSK